MEQIYQVNEPKDFLYIIKDIFQWYSGKKVGSLSIMLSGELGAGKTTFVQELAKVLAIQESITSPTFTIMKQYRISDNKEFDHLVHIDAYRFESEEEAKPIRLHELFSSPQAVICVEWPEQISSYIPSDAVQIRIDTTTDGRREVSVKYPPNVAVVA